MCIQIDKWDSATAVFVHEYLYGYVCVSCLVSIWFNFISCLLSATFTSLWLPSGENCAWIIPDALAPNSA